MMTEYLSSLLTIYNTKPITLNLLSPRMPSDANAKFTHKRNIVLYLEFELVKKSREYGFNLSKTFENHLKQLISQLTNQNWWAGPDLNRRLSACQADVLLN